MGERRERDFMRQVTESGGEGVLGRRVMGGIGPEAFVRKLLCVTQDLVDCWAEHVCCAVWPTALMGSEEGGTMRQKGQELSG
jgi:hypothetical protein